MKGHKEGMQSSRVIPRGVGAAGEVAEPRIPGLCFFDEVAGPGDLDVLALVWGIESHDGTVARSTEVQYPITHIRRPFNKRQILLTPPQNLAYLVILGP